MQKISFTKFNFKNGIIHLLILFFTSIIFLLLGHENIFEFKIWFFVLLLIGFLITYFNYRIWKKLKNWKGKA